MALAAADVFIVLVSAIISNYVLLALQCGISHEQLVVSIALSAVTCLGGLTICGAYSKLWRYFHAMDYLSCVYGILVGIVCSCLFIYILDGTMPVRYVCLHTVLSIIGICTFRYIFKRTFIELVDVGRREAKYKRTMIVGGGQACKLLIREIHNAQLSPYTGDKSTAIFDPVCIIDDDRKKIGQDIAGVQIVGVTTQINKFVHEFEIEQIVFCIPSCLEEERKRILDICSRTNIPVKVIPFLGNLLFDDANTTLLGQIRDIKVEDLLGRDPIRFDNKDIRDFISGKICMVTGGGGSIGSELVRQIARYDPKQIIIVDICENYAYDIQQELIETYGKNLNLVVRIASVRDYFRMNQLFQQFHPQVVFHAAAHKHVPLMEESPMEAIKNNVIGTFNVASLAQFHNVQKFVMISTDKAVNPTNCMGASKRCCEMIVQYLSGQPDCKTEFVTTRFGNVLGSNGSVIPKFKRQIENGQAVTVTHPDIIRYFMTIPEAVSLVMEAAVLAHGGEIFVLDMGQPVRIVQLAENLIRMYGKVPYKDVKIEFTGLRPGEKIKEELLMNEEGLQKTRNKLIFIGKQIDIDQEQFIAELRKLRDAALENNEQVAITALHNMVPTFVTPEEFNQQYLKEERPEVKKVPVAV
ncbi:MAG: polysaccharide biosynthesis protein [Oscillospiraceae bacterium]|nr:polysaccharide biosynthesis protein [Oscillospiraceae bacterium]